jgi:hypothetical protein
MKPTCLFLAIAAVAGCLLLALISGSDAYAQQAGAPIPIKGASNATLDKKTKFMQLIETAERFADRAEFSYAILFYNDALQASHAPEDALYNSRVQKLHELLASQNEPAEVTIQSDGRTSVHIANFSTPSHDKITNLKLYPRDYVIVGTRSGYREVHVLAEVRAGIPPKTYTVICEEREQPNKPE